MRVNTILSAGALGSLLLAQGCIATRDWVKEQMDPVSNRVTESETRLTKGEGRLTQSEKQITTMDNKITGIEGKLGQFEGRLGQVDAKADKALNALSNLRLERRFVIDLKEGANFAFGSSNLPNQAQKEIDGFLSDLKGDPSGAGNTVFVMDPLKVMSVSYGESAPLTENNNAQNRAKNRRVEILVYREAITSEAVAATPQANSPAPQSETLSKRQ
jgi:outer membrane protein OmpA-like peptidoglycan-associated protein